MQDKRQGSIHNLQNLQRPRLCAVRTFMQMSPIRGLLWWIFASLLAIVLLQANALLGLGAAVAGGIVFGILLFAK